MPRILIADDNSNIQRMAALALKDVGIEVVAVGNGEAAVRKLAEISPDLVLADIFMPVRNGYEVCEFVKHDPKYSNIPVLLLAGAFDPFDEHEAQRVHADGILKKPFVPPDPLINAVKTLLEKSAGERLMAASVPAQAGASTQSAATAAATTDQKAAVAELPAQPAEDAEAEAFEPLSVVDFLTNSTKDAAKEKAPPFASALSFEVPEVDEAEPVVTASRDPVLGEPAFWVPEEMQREQQTTSEEADEESVEDLTDHTWNSAHPASMRDDPDPPLMLDLESPKPAAAVHEVDLTEVGQVASPVQEPAKEPAKEFANEFPVASLPQFEPFSAPAAESPAQHTMDSSPWGSTPAAPPVSAAPAMPASSSLLAAPEISAPAASPSDKAKTSADDTLPLPERVQVTAVEAAEVRKAPPQNFWFRAPLPAPEVKLSEAAEPRVSDAPAVAEIPVHLASAPVSAPSAVPADEDEDSALLELEDAISAFAEFAAPVPASVEPIRKAEPVIEHPVTEKKAAEHEVADDWPPVFVPVTSTRANQTPKPAFEIAASPSILPSLTAPAPAAPTAPTALSVSREATAELAQEAAGLASLSPEAQEAVIQRVIERMQPQIVEVLRPLIESLVRNELRK